MSSLVSRRGDMGFWSSVLSWITTCLSASFCPKGPRFCCYRFLVLTCKSLRVVESWNHEDEATCILYIPVFPRHLQQNEQLLHMLPHFGRPKNCVLRWSWVWVQMLPSWWSMIWSQVRMAIWSSTWLPRLMSRWTLVKTTAGVAVWWPDNTHALLSGGTKRHGGTWLLVEVI